MAFVNTDRNKRSVVLDLKDPADRPRLLQLVEWADVSICSIRPKAMAALGLSDDDLADANPRAIRMYVTGFGDSGPRSADPAYDGLLQTLSGLAYVQGEERALNCCTLSSRTKSQRCSPPKQSSPRSLSAEPGSRQATVDLATRCSGVLQLLGPVHEKNTVGFDCC